jgi:hypothetical protein
MCIYSLKLIIDGVKHRNLPMKGGEQAASSPKKFAILMTS